MCTRLRNRERLVKIKLKKSFRITKPFLYDYLLFSVKYTWLLKSNSYTGINIRGTEELPTRCKLPWQTNFPEAIRVYVRYSLKLYSCNHYLFFFLYMTTIKSWNCTFTSISWNEVENKMQIECPWYETDYFSAPKSFDLQDMVELYTSKMQ